MKHRTDFHRPHVSRSHEIHSHGRGTHRTSAVALAVACQLGAAGAALAYDPDTDLGRVSGLSELQQRTGDAVQTVCGGFVNEGIDQSRDDVAEQAVLFDKCGEMVHTARVLAGEEPGVPMRTSKALQGVGAEQLGAALQNVSAEEIAAAGSLMTESSSQQNAAVGRRLASVLSQASTLQVAAAGLRGGTALALLDPSDNGIATGGGAAADDDGLVPNRLGVYVNALGAAAEKRATEGEDGFEATSAGFSVGVDYLFDSDFLLGVNIGYVSTETDFDTTEDVSGGDIESDQVNTSLYGLWFGDAGYVDLVAGFGSGSFALERSVLIQGTEAGEEGDVSLDDTVVGEPDSTSFRLGVGGGLEFVTGPLSFAPYARLSWLTVDLDGYEESGSALALRVESQSIDSLTGGFGFRLVGTWSGTRAVLQPQFNVELVREFMDDSRQIVSSYVHDPRDNRLIIVTDDPDRSYYSMGLGLTAVFTTGVQLFGEVRSLADLDDLDEFAATGGVRFEF